jgi:hypothetical protein
MMRTKPIIFSVNVTQKLPSSSLTPFHPFLVIVLLH